MALKLEIRRLSELAGPVVVTQLATMMLGVVDTIMVGRVSVEALASVALGHLWTFGTLIVVLGTLFGLDPLVSQAHGAKNRRLLGETLQQGLILALILSIPLAFLWQFTGPAMRLMGQEASLIPDAASYTQVQVWSIPCFLIYTVLRQYLQGRGILAPALWTALLANLFNALANWIFIYGNWGAPEMGPTGAGVATSLTRLFLMVSLALVFWNRRLLRGGWVPWTKHILRPRQLGAILHFGWPVGIQMGLEVWAFQACTLMAGLMGTVSLASHTIALNLASLSFMMPLGVSIAAVTRVGNLLGAKNPSGAQRAAWVAMGMGVSAMAFSALLFIIFRWQLPHLYTDEREVILLCAKILPIAAAFQLVDGVQVVGTGILRGMGTTRPTAIINFFGFYGLALPLAWFFGFHMEWGLEGIWWGLAGGLAAVAIPLLLWVWKRGPATVGALALERRS